MHQRLTLERHRETGGVLRENRDVSGFIICAPCRQNVNAVCSVTKASSCMRSTPTSRPNATARGAGDQSAGRQRQHPHRHRMQKNTHRGTHRPPPNTTRNAQARPTVIQGPSRHGRRRRNGGRRLRLPNTPWREDYTSCAKTVNRSKCTIRASGKTHRLSGD